MKRTIPLSLLLLIAGNGLIVTQAHAGFLDKVKNKIYKSSVDLVKSHPELPAQLFSIGMCCSLLGAMAGSASTSENVEILNDVVENGDGDSNAATQQNDRNEYLFYKKLNSFAISAIAFGAPLMALGLYLNKKG